MREHEKIQLVTNVISADAVDLDAGREQVVHTTTEHGRFVPESDYQAMREAVEAGTKLRDKFFSPSMDLSAERDTFFATLARLDALQKEEV